MAAAIVLGMTGCGSDGSAQLDEQVQRDDAKSACHTWVKERLKSPSTAKFSEETYKGTGGVYTFKGAVDSENGFGAMLRSTWTCKVHSAGDEWKGNVSFHDGGA